MKYCGRLFPRWFIWGQKGNLWNRACQSQSWKKSNKRGGSHFHSYLYVLENILTKSKVEIENGKKISTTWRYSLQAQFANAVWGHYATTYDHTSPANNVWDLEWLQKHTRFLQQIAPLGSDIEKCWNAAHRVEETPLIGTK